MFTQKVKDLVEWDSIKLDVRTILPEDLEQFSAEQKEAFLDLEVERIGCTDNFRVCLNGLSEATIRDRFHILQAMNFLMTCMNNEEAYYGGWIYTVPDEASDEDLEDIAEDTELYKDCCELFRSLLRRYGKDGFYAFGDKEAY